LTNVACLGQRFPDADAAELSVVPKYRNPLLVDEVEAWPFGGCDYVLDGFSAAFSTGTARLLWHSIRLSAAPLYFTLAEQTRRLGAAAAGHRIARNVRTWLVPPAL
jgi:hypothetical protein